MQWFTLVNADEIESTRTRAERHHRIWRKIWRRLVLLLVNAEASFVTTIEGFQPCGEHASGGGVRDSHLLRVYWRYSENRGQGESGLQPLTARTLGSHARTGHPVIPRKVPALRYEQIFSTAIDVRQNETARACPTQKVLLPPRWSPAMSARLQQRIFFDQLAHPIDEDAYLCGEVAALGIHDRYRQLRRRPVRQHWHELT